MRNCDARNPNEIKVSPHVEGGVSVPEKNKTWLEVVPAPSLRGFEVSWRWQKASSTLWGTGRGFPGIRLESRRSGISLHSGSRSRLALWRMSSGCHLSPTTCRWSGRAGRGRAGSAPDSAPRPSAAVYAQVSPRVSPQEAPRCTPADTQSPPLGAPPSPPAGSPGKCA